MSSDRGSLVTGDDFRSTYVLRTASYGDRCQTCQIAAQQARRQLKSVLKQISHQKELERCLTLLLYGAGQNQDP